MQTFSRLSGFLRFLRYFSHRALTVGLTLVAGVFLTVVAANHTGQIDSSIERKLTLQAQQLWRERYSGFNSATRAEELQAIYAELYQQYGLDRGFLLRHLRYTYDFLRLDWGGVQFTAFRARGVSSTESATARAIILQGLPNTLLLVGAANLLIFVIGIPLALLLSRRFGSWLDRLFMLLAPISSIPSWVLGLLLVLVFAVELRLLPVSGMRDIIVDLSPGGRTLSLVRHMVLPVSAIVLSQVFQLAFTWRSYLLVYANEDYVELAKAKGLKPQVIQRDYVLRSAYPFILTSFALTLVGFWQTTIALEVVFGWPGVGQLFIRSLPHFFNESMFPGEMVITVGLVVLFAYILGVAVLALDFLYAIVDPRIRLNTGRTGRRPTSRRQGLWRRWRATRDWRPAQARSSLQPWGARLRARAANAWQGLRRIGARVCDVGHQLLGYPSAVVGAGIITLLVAGSLFAVIALPYADIATSWRRAAVTGRIDTPRLAKPGWVSLLLGERLLERELLDSRNDNPAVTKTSATRSNGDAEVTLAFTFDFEYDLPPEEIYVYFYPEYSRERPFVFWSWIRPDGTVVELSGLTVARDERVALLEYVFRGPRAISQAKDARPELLDVAEVDLPRAWLFSATAGERLAAQPGVYRLEIQARFFEPQADMEAEVVMLGQTFGPAGTDLYRRDLMVPLLWGMPIALIFGLLGASLTVLVSVTAAAVGVWAGSWVDDLLQRLADANLVLPVLAISVLAHAYFGLSLWALLAIIILLSTFGSPLKTFRSAFLQVIEEPYIEAARTYGASGLRVVFTYMLPRIYPVILPQLITLIPGFVFLEATLGMFNINTVFPTWGKVIYEATINGIGYGSRFWVLQPLSLLLLTGVGFALLGYALDKVLNPRLNQN